MVLGRSPQGRPIVAWRAGDPSSRRIALVVGCVHGNETSGIAIARALVRRPAPRGTAIWIVPDLNPDGVAAGTRQNGDGVDLNRNFPWRWRPLGPRGSTYYAGPAAMSEAETRIAMRLIRRIRPSVSIWFHQHLDVVDESGGDVAVERRFARLVGMRVQRLARYPGSAVGWENNILQGSTAFVVELPGGAVAPARAGVFARAIESLVATTR